MIENLDFEVLQQDFRLVRVPEEKDIQAIIDDAIGTKKKAIRLKKDSNYALSGDFLAENKVKLAFYFAQNSDYIANSIMLDSFLSAKENNSLKVVVLIRDQIISNENFDNI